MANGGIIGPVNIPTSTTATGVWQQEEQYEAKVTDTWPQRALFTTKSARFNSASSDYLNRTPGSASNRRTFTFSSWIKRSALSNFFSILGGNGGSNGNYLTWWDDDTLAFTDYNGADFIVRTNAKFRDVSAWYHLVLSVDSTQGTAANRIKIYVNGVQETSLAQSSYPSQNYDFEINNNVIQYVGHNSYNYMNGYMAETILVDGTQLAPTSFGVTNSDGVWTPIPYSGTYGTNGFNLQFENAAALGTDSSPNGNTFTVNNLTSIDQSTDYPEVNFATMNSLLLSVASLNFTDGNLTNNGNSSSTWRTMYSTIGASAGKWYFEIRINKTKTSDPNNFIVGIQDAEQMFQAADTAEISSTSRGYGYRGNGGNKVNNTTGSGSSYGNSYGSIGDIVGCAVDLDSHKIYWSKNGTFQNSGNPDTGSTGTGSAFDLTTGITYMFGISSYYDDDRHSFNFGSPPFAISSGNADGNGFGNFEYAVPSGYFSLCTKNLAEYG